MKFDEIVETVVQYEKVKNHLEQRPEDIKLVKEFLKEITSSSDTFSTQYSDSIGTGRTSIKFLSIFKSFT